MEMGRDNQLLFEEGLSLSTWGMCVGAWKGEQTASTFIDIFIIFSFNCMTFILKVFFCVSETGEQERRGEKKEGKKIIEDERMDGS